MKKMIIILSTLLLITSCSSNKINKVKDIYNIDTSDVNEIIYETRLVPLGPGEINKVTYKINDKEEIEYYKNILNEKISLNEKYCPVPGGYTISIYYNDKVATFFDNECITYNENYYILKNRINKPQNYYQIYYNFTNYEYEYKISDKNNNYVKSINNLHEVKFKSIDEVYDKVNLDFQVDINVQDKIYLYEENKFMYSNRTFEIIDNNIFADLYK